MTNDDKKRLFLQKPLFVLSHYFKNLSIKSCSLRMGIPSSAAFFILRGCRMNVIIDEEIRLFGDTSRHLAATLFNECLQFLSVGELLQIPCHNKGQPCQSFRRSPACSRHLEGKILQNIRKQCQMRFLSEIIGNAVCMISPKPSTCTSSSSVAALIFSKS